MVFSVSGQHSITIYHPPLPMSLIFIFFLHALLFNHICKLLSRCHHPPNISPWKDPTPALSQGCLSSLLVSTIQQAQLVSLLATEQNLLDSSHHCGVRRGARWSHAQGDGEVRRANKCSVKSFQIKDSIKILDSLRSFYHGKHFDIVICLFSSSIHYESSSRTPGSLAYWSVAALLNKTLGVIYIVNHGSNDTTGTSIKSSGDESSGIVAHTDDGETGRKLFQPLNTFKSSSFIKQSVLLVNQNSSESQLCIVLGQQRV